MTNVGMQEIAAGQNPMSVYQNLSANELGINISSTTNAPAEIYITDTQGRRLQTIFSGMLRLAENGFSADISELNSGIYFVVYRGETIQCKKIAK